MQSKLLADPVPDLGVSEQYILTSEQLGLERSSFAEQAATDFQPAWFTAHNHFMDRLLQKWRDERVLYRAFGAS